MVESLYPLIVLVGPAAEDVGPLLEDDRDPIPVGGGQLSPAGELHVAQETLVSS